MSTDEENPMDDILGNQSILKKTIRSGEGNTRPSRNNLAEISYKLYLIDPRKEERQLIEEVSNEEFFIGEYDVLSAIDLSIQLMDRGEQALIDSDIRHCYGEKGYPEKNIPPVIDGNPSYRMQIELELHQWKIAEEIQSLSVEKRIFWSDRKREKGNFSFRRQDYSTAIQCYRHAIPFVDINEHPSIDDEQVLLDRYIHVQNNLAQVYLLNHQYDQCLETIEKVLKFQPKNIKALYRQAKALFQLGNYDQSVEPLKILLELDHPDIEKDKVRDMLKICQTKLAKYHQNQKEICQRMFQSKSAATLSETSSSSSSKKEKIDQRTNPWMKYSIYGSFIILALALVLMLKFN